VNVVGVSLKPLRPRAGGRAAAQLLLAGEAAQRLASSARLTCLAHVGRLRLVKLAGSVQRRAAAEGLVARCSWRVPRGAHGSKLRATVRLSGGGVTVGRTIVRRIR
jgi:hypothetical protein